MISDIDSILHKAEDEYLEQQDLANFKGQIFALEKRLQIYEIISSKETEIFQSIATRLANNPDEPDKIRLGLKHWLMVMRYCAMAMLLDNPDYLKYRLEWLSEQVEAYQTKAIEQKIFELLQKRFQKVLDSEQLSILKPYLEQTRNALLK